MTPEERFRVAVETLLRHEGGYVDDPADDGGATNFGLSSVHHPDLDVANLTRPQAIEEYRRRYWVRFRLGEIDDPVIATKCLDLCVWMGYDDMATYLQEAICAAAGGPIIAIDGVAGSKTLAALRTVDGGMVLVALRALAADHVRRQVEGDPTKRRFLKGWTRRAFA